MKRMKVLCKSIKYREFPDLLFDTSPDNGIVYFNASSYLRQKGDLQQHSIEAFRQKFDKEINVFIEYYGLNPDEVFVIEHTSNDVLIDESLAFAFIHYIDPYFYVYLMERGDEMLQNGYVLSDTIVYQTAKHRLNKDQLIQLLNEH